jgi:hypothetical protein
MAIIILSEFGLFLSRVYMHLLVFFSDYSFSVRVQYNFFVC